MFIRFPAEWEEQDGVLLSWPHESTDWRQHLKIVEPVFAEIIRNISRFESVLIASPEPERVSEKLILSGTDMGRVSIYAFDSNDTWARDFGPIAVEADGSLMLMDFVFNGWGLKFPADLDNQISRRLYSGGAFKVPLCTSGFVLEGGSIESDGNGTLLTTSNCLLGPNRNPHLNKPEIEAELKKSLGANQVLWLHNGYLAGDDTDSHVDTLARLCPDNTILHVSCDDRSDEHYDAIDRMVRELAEFRTVDGKPYRLIPLPWPQARFDDDGQRLPATYANFLVINGAVLVPTYDDPGDDAAMNAVSRAYPDRQIIGVDCRPLILQHGSLHCVTMQLPKGTLSLKGEP
jgi:agmatine deiminase